MQSWFHPTLRTASVLCLLGCGGSNNEPSHETGTIVVYTSTEGAGSDADGYMVVLDDVPQAPVGLAETLQLDSIPVGSHKVRLDGIDQNCNVAFVENPSSGQNPRSVVVEGGATVTVYFLVYCTHPSPTLEVTTTTTGPVPDPDGYLVAVDAEAPQIIGVNASVLVGSVTPSSHTVTLSGLASNCQINGENPQTIGPLGFGEEAVVMFTVFCS
jgi:hypothetical protein